MEDVAAPGRSAVGEVAMWRWIFFAASCLVSAGCSAGSGTGPSAGPVDAGGVYEAAFRYRLQKQTTDVRAYLSVEGRDPSDDLLNRLRREWPNLGPASEEPAENGYSISVERLEWVDGNTAVLRLRTGHNTRVAPDRYFADYRVVRRGGKWIVAEVSNETMS